MSFQLTVAGAAMLLLGACAVQPTPGERPSPPNQEERNMSAPDQPGNTAQSKPGAPGAPARPEGKPDPRIVPSPWQPPAEVDPVPPGLGNETPPG